jgi:hypothetical protein
LQEVNTNIKNLKKSLIDDYKMSNFVLTPYRERNFSLGDSVVPILSKNLPISSFIDRFRRNSETICVARFVKGFCGRDL